MRRILVPNFLRSWFQYLEQHMYGVHVGSLDHFARKIGVHHMRERVNKQGQSLLDLCDHIDGVQRTQNDAAKRIANLEAQVRVLTKTNETMSANLNLNQRTLSIALRSLENLTGITP